MPPLDNRKMQIRVIGDVELDGKTFRPSDLNAQATDPTCDRWYIFYDTDDYACTAELSELEQRKKEGLISYE
jgi:hypothetical protein